jgi:hypothetical protein
MRFIHILCLLPLYLWLTVTFAQQTQELTIAGTVVNEEGEPMTNISIYVKDKANIGTSTDGEGKFSIKAAIGDKIVFTSVGYEPVEYVAVKSIDNLSMSLTEKTAAIGRRHHNG